MVVALDRLDKMNLDDLIKVREKVENAIERRVTTERTALQAKLAELSALTGNGKSRPTRSSRPTGKNPARSKKAHPLKGRKAPPKYRGPGGETWSGRGLPPRWLAALEKKGRKRDTFLIE
jgi:DNA-binding protein H-NS